MLLSETNSERCICFLGIHLPKSSRTDWKCHVVLDIHQTVSDGDAKQRGGCEYRETSLTIREAHSSSRWRKRATEDTTRDIIKSTDLERPATLKFSCSYGYERQRFSLTPRLHSIKLIRARRKAEQTVLFYFCSGFPVEMCSSHANHFIGKCMCRTSSFEAVELYADQ